MTRDTVRDLTEGTRSGGTGPAPACGPPPAPAFTDLLFDRLHGAAPHPDAGFTIGVALVLEGPAPDPDRLRERVAALLPALPALTCL
ncbi:hypothetical protein [Streptomyces clavuligerus]|uniref:hypothetical protein n=1 Tax=Streptomyces clavuligerus TaxID=1901 RepID=UPI001E559E9E|nr:hypothetical protein [Streptomyces clavuligerus]